MPKQPKLPVPPLTADSWKTGALACLALMTKEGQRRALAEWKKLGFTPPLPT